MKKEETKKLNSVQKVLMADIRNLKNKDYREGYKMGFNTCRRRIRKLLLGIIKKNP